MKIVLALSLLGLALFCVFGFLASAEVSDPSEQERWRWGYAILGLLSFLGSVALNSSRRHRPWG